MLLTLIILPMTKIIIVGGGSAGWMTAATLESQFPQHSISLIESKNIPTIGVGESTILPIQRWMKLLKIKDEDFLKHVDGNYKLSIRFTDFYKKGEFFHYPFGTPVTEGNKYFLNDWWFKKILFPKTPYSDYAECNYPLQMAYVNANKFNKKLDYAYQVDAAKFGAWLRDYYCKKVKHIIDDVVSVEQNENGIVSLNKKYKADLYIDCTGFKSLLLGKSLKEPFESYSDILPNDSAWATRLQYKNKKKELTTYTNCTAIENGWVWRVPLWSRIGTGYVYSSKFVDDETALKEFKKHLKEREKVSKVDQLNFRNIKSRVGMYKRLWVKNVAAIGLAAAFVEPLESNALFTVHEFLISLVRNLQRNTVSQWDKDIFNHSCKRMFRSWAEFVALHYALSHRDDTPYWRHCLNKNWSESLVNLKPEYVHGFQVAALNQSEDFSFPVSGGLHCIAAGMHWAPTDIPSLTVNSTEDIEDIKKSFVSPVNQLQQRKEVCKKLVEKEKTIFTILKNAQR